MQPRIMKTEEQRARYLNNAMASVGLEAKLHTLVRQSLEGDLSAAQEFQQFIQYAPLEMRARIQERISQQ